MKPDSDPRLPRSPDDPENLRRLREEALRRLEDEERLSPATVYGAPAPVYGGPPPKYDRPTPDDAPAPVYGGPPPFGGGGLVSRRWTLWGLLLVALGAVAAIIAWLFKGRRNGISEYLPSMPQATVYGGPPIPPPQPPSPPADAALHTAQTLIYAIQTSNGHFLTAVNGGGLGDPKSAPDGVALTTSARTPGPFETFTFIWVNKSGNTFALKTNDGHFVTAVNGGGIGGPDNGPSPIHADATAFEPWAKFTINLLPDNIHATIQTADGRHFLSAANGGSVGGSNQMPIHTDATTMEAGAVFQFVPIRPAQRSPVPVYGGPPPMPHK